jgi:4-hydroxy-tetrahydrodipicolinate synthase
VKLDGIIVPLITPLKKDESLDEAGLEKMVEHVISGGVSGIFLLGSCGEGPAIMADTQEQLVRRVSVLAKGRVPVLVGAPGAGTQQTIVTTRRLMRQGGDYVVCVAPFYFSHSQDEQFAHFAAIAGQSPAPLMLYNIPQMTKTLIEPETVARLAEVPNIVAIKDSFGDMARFQRVVAIKKQHPDFGVYQGAEAVAALSMVRGANGCVLGVANVAPRLCCDLYAAVHAGDLARAWVLQEQLVLLMRLYTHGTWLSCLKASLNVLGLCGATASAPFSALSADATAALRKDLVAAGVIAAS